MIRQRGLAAVTALLIVAVAASAATLMLAQQSAMLDQTAMVASRAQAEAYGQAGFDWARGVLMQDAASVDSLGEGWAQPMAGLPVERAVVSGFIVDEQGKFNLNNLVRDGKKSERDMEIFARLLANVGLPGELAHAVVDWIDKDSDLAGAGGAEDAYYLALARPHRAANQAMQQVEELYRVRGFDAKAVQRLRPHVSALPVRTKVNANTATEAVLAAVLHEVPREQLAALLATRTKAPMQSAAAIAKATEPKGSTATIEQDLDVKSGHFMVSVGVAQDDVQIAGDALFERKANGATVMIWRRPRY
jgi:general secretion pathway protein K